MVIRKRAKEIFLKNNRFDLIFKYIYIKNKDKKTSFFKDLYLNHIKAFNNFYEEENVRVRVPWITSNHITFYSRNYVFPDNQTHSTIVIVGDLFSKVWKNLDLYWTSMKYEVNPRPNPKVRTITYKHGDSVSGCKL